MKLKFVLITLCLVIFTSASYASETADTDDGGNPFRSPDEIIPPPRKPPPDKEKDYSIHTAVEIALGRRRSSFNFLDESVSVPSVSISVPIAYRNTYFFAVGLDSAIFDASISKTGQQKEVSGNVSRRDYFIQAGYALYTPPARRWLNGIIGYIGYTYGKTTHSFDDGVIVDIVESGPLCRFSIDVMKWKTYMLSFDVGYSYLYNSSISVKTALQTPDEKSITAEGLNYGLRLSTTFSNSMLLKIGVKNAEYDMDNHPVIGGSAKLREDFLSYQLGVTYLLR